MVQIFGETIAFLLKPQETVLGASRARGVLVLAQNRKKDRVAGDRRVLTQLRHAGKRIWRWWAGDPIAKSKKSLRSQPRVAPLGGR